MPHPGQEVATSRNFGGDLSDIDPKFRKNVEEFVSKILLPENIIPKTMNGQMIKVKDLVDLIETYWECFRDGQMPTIQSLYQAAGCCQHMAAMNEAETVYKEQMRFVEDTNYPILNDADLTEKHNDSKGEALQYFHKFRKIGNRSTNEEYEEKLNMKLEKIFLDYKQWNGMKSKKFGGIFKSIIALPIMAAIPSIAAVCASFTGGASILVTGSLHVITVVSNLLINISLEE